MRQHTKTQLLRKKQEAKRLIITLGYNQKEAAKKVGVTENTMTKWCKQFGWSNSIEHQIRQLHEGNLHAFAFFIEKNDPQTFKKVIALLISYLTSNK